MAQIPGLIWSGNNLLARDVLEALEEPRLGIDSNAFGSLSVHSNWITVDWAPTKFN